MPHFTYNPLVEKQFTDNEQRTENFRSTLFSLSGRSFSPENMSPGACSYSFVKVSVGDKDDYTNKFHKDDDDDDNDDEDSEINSYFFKTNSSYREGTDHDEGVGVDEAIAWAKESYQSHCSSAEMTEMPDEPCRVAEMPDGTLQQGEYPNKMKTEKIQRNEDEYREMELLEEGIKLWSFGKERNIELLLSTLQDILWPNSGWSPIPPTNMYESSNVKKAYQKARLCLHPDKLQQRGATLLQKHVAERIFLILQDAWDTYISQDIIILS